MFMECRVGAGQASDGSDARPRLGKSLELIQSRLHAPYYESVSRAMGFTASTAVAGVAPGTALSTTPPMAVHNPPGSGILVSINRVFVGYVSGTLGAGSMVHGQVTGQNTDPTGGAELTARCGLLSGTRAAARVYQGATLVAAPAIIRPSIIMGAALATSVAFPGMPAMDPVEGAIVVPPGAVWAYQGVAAAGTTPLVLIGVDFEEILIP